MCGQAYSAATAAHRRMVSNRATSLRCTDAADATAAESVQIKAAPMAPMVDTNATT